MRTTSSQSTPEAEAHRIVADVVKRRLCGEWIPDDQVISEYPGLEQCLRDELRTAEILRKAYLAALKAGPALDALPQSADSDLDAPLPDGSLAEGGKIESLNPSFRDKPNYINGYTILSEINSGGQAAVFRAIQEATGKTVAIKILPGGSLIRSDRRVRFDREAKILARFDHPNIVGILDRGRTADGSFFLVMNYIDGWSLDEYLQVRSDWGWQPVANLFVKILRAVQAVHQHGVVHRDLKPSNIRIDRNGEPHVLDFGLAQLIQSDHARFADRTVTTTGQLLGSLPWTSPEHVLSGSRHLDRRTDIYSIGVMLYVSITGRFPYDVSGPIRTVLDEIVGTSPPPPSRVKVPDGTPHHLADEIVLRALNKAPAGRFSSAAEMADALERSVGGLSPCRSSWAQKGVPTRFKRGLAILVVGVSAALGFSKLCIKRQPPRTHATIELPRFTNSIGQTFVRIPAGQFVLGSPTNERGRDNNEQLHEETIDRPFYLAVTEVTVAQYQQIMGIERPGAVQTNPVDAVSWKDAAEFCRRLSKREHRVYRLPTNSQWEYACRAGSTTMHSGSRSVDEVAWYAGNSGDRLHPVATRVENSWGLHDMLGSVAEWCAGTDDSSTSRASDPAARPQQPIRGGSAFDGRERCRAASCVFLNPEVRQKGVGFRVALDASD